MLGGAWAWPSGGTLCGTDARATCRTRVFHLVQRLVVAGEKNRPLSVDAMSFTTTSSVVHA